MAIISPRTFPVYVNVEIDPDSGHLAVSDLNYTLETFNKELAKRNLDAVCIPTSHKLDEGGAPLYSKDEILNYIKIMNTDDLLELKRKVDKELSTREIKLL